MNALAHIRGNLVVQTRTGREVANYFDGNRPAFGIFQACDGARREFKSARHRPTEPSAHYNCHGLTFAGRRTSIESPDEVLDILSDDGYERIPRHEVMSGDVVVYFKDGAPDHSGIVMSTEVFGDMWILSKWGELHEVVHRPSDCVYDASDIRFYRISR